MRRCSLPSINLEIDCSSEDWHEIGKILAQSLWENGKNSEETGEEAKIVYSKRLAAVLSKRQIDILRTSNLIEILGGNIVWNFEPFLGRGLILFCDHACYQFNREYVWLRTKVASGSWAFSQSLERVEGLRVLDLGCGSGLNALLLAQRGAKSVGIDINPRAVQISRLNRLLNGLSVDFVHSSWNTYREDDYDIWLSQPPFDPQLADGNQAYAFGGGSEFGLEYTLELIRRFSLSSNAAQLRLYTHSFVKEGVCLLESKIERLFSPRLKLAVSGIRQYQIAEWWSKYKLRHGFDRDRSLPREWNNFDQVAAMFLTVGKQ